MKRFVSLILFLFLISTLSTVFAADPIPAENISLDQSTAFVAIGKSITLKATVTPKNASNKKVIWTSSDESVATVKDGKVKGVSEGKVIITASTEDGSGVSASAEISVIIPVKKITLSETKTFPLAPWVPWRITTTVEPFNATIYDVNWTSSDESVATVDQNGVVTGKAPGTAKITAVAKDGSNAKASVTVKVKNYDLVFQTKSSQSVEYYYTSGIFTITSHVDTGCVKIPILDDGMLVAMGKTVIYKTLSVTPIKPGEDVVTINVSHQNKFTYTVFVSPEMFSDASSSIQNIESTESSEFLFMNTPWGSTYDDAKRILNEQGKHLKPPGKRNDYLRALIKEDIFFADCTAYTAALNFTYNANDADPKTNSSFYKGDLYFQLDYPFDQVHLAVRKFYGLDHGNNSNGVCTWEKDNIRITLSQKEKFIILELEKISNE